MPEKYTFTKICSIIGLVLMLACMFLMGGGHGTYVPAKFFFPYAMWVANLQNVIGAVSMDLAIVQFPLYGFIIDLSENIRRGMVALIIIILTHLLAFIYVINMPGDSF